MKFQDKSYVIFDHNKCPPSETEDEKCIFRKSYFHRIQPKYQPSGYRSVLNNVFWFSPYPLLTTYESGSLRKCAHIHRSDLFSQSSLLSSLFCHPSSPSLCVVEKLSEDGMAALLLPLLYKL